MREVREHKNRQPFREHVRELRQVFMMSALYVLIGSSIGYALYRPLFAILIKPYHNPLYYTTVAGAFNAIFKVSILFGIIVAIPLIFHKIYKFVSPALPAGIQFFTVKLIGLSFLFAITGVAYGYFISLPATLHFLTNVGPTNVNPLVEVSGYLNFVFRYLIGMAIIFQFPLILLIINKIKPLTPSGLNRYQRHAIAGSTVIAAIITPTTDPINMGLMMIPVLGLFELGIIFIWLANRRSSLPKYKTVRPFNVEPVVVNPIPLNFGQNGLAAPLKPNVVQPPEVLLAPVIIEPQVIQTQMAPERVVVRVVPEAKSRLLPSLQGYSASRIVKDILPPMANA